MRLFPNALSVRPVWLASISAAALIGSAATAANQAVSETNLVTDSQAFLTSQGYTPAVTQDASLINPWGTSFSATSPFWTSNQGAGNATLYNGLGAKQALTVTIPGSAQGPSGPTGQVFNATANDFVLGNGAKATFIFANLNGTISGWNGAAGTTALVQVNKGPGNVYTGLAAGSSGGQNYLYAANAAAGTVDVFNGSFAQTMLAGSFTDPTLPAGLAPFNVANMGGQLYVTYAPPGPAADEAPLGTGAVSVFNTDGTFVRRFATGGNLLSPWGLAKAPTGFGIFGDAILVGNFAEEDGFINAFRESDGAYLGMLTMGSDPFRMPYLWSLAFRTGGAGNDLSALYFTAGIGDEEHGLFGRLNAVPEPATWALMVAGFGLAGWQTRRRPARVRAGT